MNFRKYINIKCLNKTISLISTKWLVDKILTHNEL